MKGKRTGVEFQDHVLTVKRCDCTVMYHLKKPDTICDNVKFINTNGILAVTGDYGNWIFCREFHPSKDGRVSDHYWCEKLQNSSTQKPYEFDGEATRQEIDEMLRDDEELTIEEKDYLLECKDQSHESEFWYNSYAHGNLPNGRDHEFPPCEEKITEWLQVVFDAYEEICRRLHRQPELGESQKEAG